MSEPAPPPRFGAWIDGRERRTERWFEVVEPYRGRPVAIVTASDRTLVEEAVAAAVRARPVMAAMPVHRRAQMLRTAADLLETRVDELAESITRQTGKVVGDTRREVARSPLTLRAAASAVESMTSATLPADAVPLGEGVTAIAQRHPVGVVAAITPFNAPLNLVVHKLAPALAAGNTVVVKPAPAAPLPALELARILERAGFPAGAVNIIPGDAEPVLPLVTHPEVAAVSFTGGTAAGEAIRREAGLKRVLLELGGNSPNIVHADANLDRAADACIRGGFANGGQSCNSVQRILVHDAVRDVFLGRLVALTDELRVGDPMAPETRIGPVVNEAAAVRIIERVDDAVAQGATVAAGGQREGALVSPTIVADAPAGCLLRDEEIFAPVILVNSYRDLDEAIAIANESAYGLQAGVFTSSLDVAMAASTRLRCGGVMVNRSSNYRLDHLPYGGLGRSGIGREGPAAAIEELTDLRLTVFAPAGADG